MEEPDAGGKRSVKERGTEAIATARARAEELLDRAEANRARSRVIDVAFGSYEHDAEVGGGILAGAVAFRVFLFIVPFVFFLVVAFGLIADAVGSTAQTAVEKSGIAGLLATTIRNVGDQSVWSRLTILVISGVALVLGARNLFKVMTVIHVLIWRMPRVRVRRQARAVSLLIVAVLGALLLAQLTSKLHDRSFPAWVFATGVFMLIPAGLWLAASLQLFPHPPQVGWRDLVPGALVVGVGIEALHIFTVVWISHSFERKSATYGAIGGSLSLLLWAYVVGRIMAASPVINAVIWRRAHALDLPPPVVSDLPPPAVERRGPTAPGTAPESATAPEPPAAAAAVPEPPTFALPSARDDPLPPQARPMAIAGPAPAPMAIAGPAPAPTLPPPATNGTLRASSGSGNGRVPPRGPTVADTTVSPPVADTTLPPPPPSFPPPLPRPVPVSPR